jgi:two-component system chemotaxis sensor kinase CheA
VTPKEALSDELRVYLDEAREQLQKMDDAGVRLEKDSRDEAAVQEFFRAAHTIKGSSAMLGFERMAAVTHEIEEILDSVRSGKRDANRDLVDMLLRAVDVLRGMLGKIGPNGEPATDIAPVLASLKKLGTRKRPARRAAGKLDLDAIASDVLERAAGEGHALVRLTVTIDPDCDAGAIRAVQALREAMEFGELLASSPEESEISANDQVSRVEALIATDRPADELRHSLETLSDVRSVSTEELLAAHGPEASRPSDAASAEPDHEGPANRIQSVRVDVDKLDEIMNLVGELVVDRNRLEQLTSELEARDDDDDLAKALIETSARIIKAVDGVNRSMMAVRMLPVGLLFSTFPRLVRDLSRKLDKEVELTIEGAQTEMDRSVLEKIRDPLVHLIRNAVDHGIETPAVRRKAAKPEKGTLLLTARQEQGYVLVSLSDDGAGIDHAAVKEAAVRRNVLSRESAAQIGDQAAVDLIFRPELSTATEATEVSGRGIGLDAVRREIEALSGSVEVRSQRGQGTTVTLKLPLTLASFPGLLVEAGGLVYAIPTRYVREAVRAGEDTVRSVVGNPVIDLRGRVTPLVSLAGLSVSGWSGAAAWSHEFVVVVDTGERLVALGVDALTDQQEIVVKPLAGYTSQTRGIAGASILGDGRVVLILDIATLFKEAPEAVLATGAVA